MNRQNGSAAVANSGGQREWDGPVFLDITEELNRYSATAPGQPMLIIRIMHQRYPGVVTIACLQFLRVKTRHQNNT